MGKPPENRCSTAAPSPPEAPELSTFIDVADRLLGAETLTDLERRYHTEVARFVTLPIRGLYLFEDTDGRVERISCANVSDAFITRYEHLGRRIDPLLAHAIEHKTSASSLALMSLEEWQRTDCYRAVSRLHHLVHVLETPVVLDNRVIGTLNFASDDPARPITPQEVSISVLFARLVGTAIRVHRTYEPQRRQNAHLRAALDAAPVAVAVMDPALSEPLLNRAAGDLVDRLVDGEDVLYRTAARPGDAEAAFSRTTPVHLKDGRSAVVRSRTRPTAPGSDVAVSVFDLDDPSFTLRGPLWSALSPREREVAELVVAGLTDREIAERLVLSPHTVRHHVKRIYQKLHVRSRVELTRLAHPSN